jgi:hypothetical protein
VTTSQVGLEGRALVNDADFLISVAARVWRGGDFSRVDADVLLLAIGLGHGDGREGYGVSKGVDDGVSKKRQRRIKIEPSK